jgi:drug/metabolite transporter (DMT)-like permease
MIFSIPFFFLEAFLWDESMIIRVNPSVLAALFYQVFITASFGFVAWNTLLKKYGAVSLHSFVFIMPISGVLLGGLVLGEPITLNLLAALLFITSGILVVHLKPKKAASVVSFGRDL